MKDNNDIHPLTFEVVVQEILRHVAPSMKDLLAFRQVCRFWRELATPLISSRSLELPMITFKAEGNVKMEVEKKAGDFFSIIHRNIGKFLRACFGNIKRVFLARRRKPHRLRCIHCNADLSLLPKYIDYLERDFHPKIIFPVLHFNGISWSHPIIQKFLQRFGHTVKKLHLNQLDEEYHLRRCKIQGKVKAATFRKLLMSCTELEELVLGCVDPRDVNVGFLLPDDNFVTKIKRMAWVQFMGDEPTKPHRMFIKDLLKVCPSLERFLTVEDSDGRFTLELANFRHLSSMKELTLPTGCPPFFGALIGDYTEGMKELRLKRLKFHRMWVNNPPEQYRRFLDTQKSSLETLIVGMWQVYPSSTVETPVLTPIPFPDVMEKLEVFKIDDVRSYYSVSNPSSPRLRLQSSDFQRQFPVLRTLILGGEAWRYDLDVLFTPWAVVEPQLVLQGLQLPEGIGHEVLARVAHLFPNVKELKLKGVTAEALGVLFAQWHRMESLFLDLKEPSSMETSLTGLSSYQVFLAKSLQKINIPKGNPSITNFQDLKELWILKENKNKVVPNLPGEFLSDLSIHYSLSKLPKLEFLCVNEHKFTEEGINHLCNARGLKWTKDSTGLKCQKNLVMKYKPRPACNEDFANYKTTGAIGIE